MKKGFVFIYGSEVVLRFITTDAFSVLERTFDITYVVLRSSELVGEGQLEGGEGSIRRKVRWIPFDGERTRRWSELFDVSCIYYKERSSSFQVRYEEQARQNPARMAHLETLAQPGVYEEHRAALEQEMGLHPDILELVVRERPDFFVLPSALLDYLTDDVLLIAQALAIPTLMLVLGWDNLSSKGLIYHQPALLGVWGEQSRRHAVEVQGVPPERVQVIGAPQYEDFYPDSSVDRSALRTRLGVPPVGRLIVFAGTFRLFDETEVLKQIDNAIEAGVLPAMHVFYRPHPWRVSRLSEDNFLDHSWRHVTMDPEMVDTYGVAKDGKETVTPDNFMFRLNHLAGVYQAADAVVSPMSTMLLEALLFGLPTMAVAFGDGKHSWSADKVSRMLHFKELYEVQGLIVCRRRDDIFRQLDELISRIGDDAFSATLRNSTGYFVHRDGQSYAERVVPLVEMMLNAAQSPPAYDSASVKPGKRYVTKGRKIIPSILGVAKRVFRRGAVE